MEKKSGENANNILRRFTSQNFCFSDVSPEFWLAYKKLRLKLKDKDRETFHFLGGCSPSSSPRLLFSATRKASWIEPWPTHAEKVVLWAGDYFALQEKLCINGWTFICRFKGQVQVESYQNLGYIWIMMKYFPGFYSYTGGASVWEEAEARSNFFVWVARSWWMFLGMVTTVKS